MSAQNKKTGRCYHTHPALEIGDRVIYGGSCITPSVLDAQVYIGFDRGMNVSRKAYPWHAKTVEFLFRIADGSTPESPEDFKRMVTWTAQQLASGAKVHAGCIGGHGRTGLFFAALVAEMTDQPDAINYVRENYCKSAVESTSQVSFLGAHYGVKTKGVKPSKSHGAFSVYDGGKTFTQPGSKTWPKGTGVSVTKSITTGVPIKVKGNVWGKTLDT